MRKSEPQLRLIRVTSNKLRPEVGQFHQYWRLPRAASVVKKEEELKQTRIRPSKKNYENLQGSILQTGILISTTSERLAMLQFFFIKFSGKHVGVVLPENIICNIPSSTIS